MEPRPRRGGESDNWDVEAACACAEKDDAGQTDGDCEVVAAALQVARETDRLVVQCAWCGRYLLGSRWVEEQELPSLPGLDAKLAADRISHSVCPDCSNVA